MGQAGHRVLVIGCGQLGSRHLQAVASLPEVAAIDVVDPRPEALALGRQRLAEVQPATAAQVRWVGAIDEAAPGGDLCIVATQADVRRQVTQAVAERLGYTRFLLEKLVTQSVADYEALMRFAAARGLSVWVNCKTRAHPSHARVKALLDPSEAITFTVAGGNHGLVNNGVHAADLFVFYDGGSPIQRAGASIDPVLHPSKRGNGMYDLSGSLHGYTAKGSQFSLSFAAAHDAPMQYLLSSRRYRAVIDDMKQRVCESSADTGWEWRVVPFEANMMVSHMTRAFASEILGSGRCSLPTLEACYPAHQFILGELLPHFNRLLGRESDRCPAT
jgi:predicted dehydrogenase